MISSALPLLADEFRRPYPFWQTKFRRPYPFWQTKFRRPFPFWQTTFRLVALPELPGIVAEERLTPDTSTLGFLRRMKSVGGITPREAYRPLSAGALRRAMRAADARFGGKITWHIVYGVLDA